MQDYWPQDRRFTPPPKKDPVDDLQVNGLPYEECSKAELAEEIYKHRRAMQQVRKGMNLMEGAQQRVPYAPADIEVGKTNILAVARENGGATTHETDDGIVSSNINARTNA